MASKDEAGRKVVVPKTAASIQRFKLEKLMKNPSKPAYLPESAEEKLPRVFNPPEFIRNIWGSSAGAGSGDFHVYRGVRRREYARQKHLDAKAAEDAADAEHRKKIEGNLKVAEEKTAKKRAKRLKKKWKQKQAKKQKKNKPDESASEEDSEEDDDEKEENDDTKKENDDKKKEET